MNQLLHIDSSVQGDQSVSRRLTARAVQRWRDTHPEGSVVYRDLASNPIPHLGDVTSPALTAELIGEIKRADTVVLGLPLYNFGPPSTVKAWVDHIVAPGLSIDAETGRVCSAIPSSSCSKVGAAATVRAHLERVGITLNLGCPMRCR